MNENNITLVNDGTTIRIYITYTINDTGELNEYNMELTSDDNPYKI